MARDVRAGRAFIELGIKDKLKGGLDKSGRQLRAFGKNVGAIGGSLMALSTTMVTPFIGALKHFADFGDQLEKMSHRTGISATHLSQLGFAAEQSGSDIDQLDNGLRGMARFMFDLERGFTALKDKNEGFSRASGGAQLAAKNLGIRFEDLAEKTPLERFDLLAEGISKIEDPTKRAALAMQVFGSRSGAKLLPLLEGGAKGIAALRKEAEGLGIAVSKQDADNAAAVTDSFNRVSRVLKQGLFNVGAALAGDILKASESVKTFLVGVGAWVNQNRGLITSIFKLGLAIGGVGAGLVTVGGIITGVGFTLSGLASIGTAVSAVVGGIGAAAAFLVSPLGLAIAGITAGGAALLYFTDVGNQTIAFLQDRFGDLLGWTREIFQGINDAIMSGNIQLAGQIFWAALQVAWLTGVAQVKAIWHGFTNFLFSTFDLVSVKIQKAFLAMIERVANMAKPFEGIAASILGVDSLDGVIGGAKGNVDKGFQRRQAQRDKKASEAAAESQRKVIEAQQKLDEAITQAAQQRKEFEQRAAEKSFESSGGGAEVAKAKMSTAGTFSAAQAAAFGGGRVVDKLKEAADKTADNTDKLVQLAEAGGIVFS